VSLYLYLPAWRTAVDPVKAINNSMKQICIILLMAIHTGGVAQSDTINYHFDYTIMEVIGDLNKDNLPDKVVVTQDTLSETAPYKLQIFFKEKNGEFTLITTSTKIIEPQYPEGRGGYIAGNGFADITIKKGILSVNFQLLRGHFEHIFRYQNGNFELIGFSMVNANGIGEMTTIDFNLSTGYRTEKTERTDNGKILSHTKKKIWIRPLPKLQTVTPMENEWY
jgi:hypothetical protein